MAVTKSSGKPPMPIIQNVKKYVQYSTNYRMSTRLIAYAQVGFLSALLISLLGVWVLAIAILFWSPENTTNNLSNQDPSSELPKLRNEDDLNFDDSETNSRLPAGMIWYTCFWIVTTLVALVLIVQLWASGQLLCATKVGISMRWSLNAASIWYRVNLISLTNDIFLIFALFDSQLCVGFYFVLITCCFRLVSVYVVNEYIMELEEQITKTYICLNA